MLRLRERCWVSLVLMFNSRDFTEVVDLQHEASHLGNSSAFINGKYVILETLQPTLTPDPYVLSTCLFNFAPRHRDHR